METFDAIVVGLGAHGSAAAAALARRGQRVLGLERFGRGEAFGSSGGWSRMIRIAHFEHPWLVPLATASWDRWQDLERETATGLLTRTGGLYGGPGDSAIVAGARDSAAGHGLAHEVLDAAEIHRRWPILQPADDTVAILEEQAGTIRIDRAIEAQLGIVEEAGGQLGFDRRVVDWRPATGGGFEVETADGQVAGGEHLVLAAGPWTAEFVPDLELPLVVEREVPMWFRPTVEPATVGADRLPIWVLRDEGTAYYGIPYDPELGLKVSIHHWGTFTDPDTVERVVGPADIERVRAFMRTRMPAANGPLANAKVCLYTNTPDETFVIDRHPAAPGVAFASACSGHGFKFAPVIGEILADLVTDGSTSWPIEPFRADRFAR
ncbi:MAG TPA: N-methyl-L-tryptophan oxidase [Verrucomicrobiae bacterium]|nr:N-methyl-L-tryptophan oxidase [Verrucomicrobiae bacterium]